MLAARAVLATSHSRIGRSVQFLLLAEQATVDARTLGPREAGHGAIGPTVGRHGHFGARKDDYPVD